ncbi:cholinergic receptor, nicotinic [Seminavis robusta]|uniref:Cholinergic receptor, nicotinic n=1 Tax=Seminavis robusta TaxID=568900 RepID=A0A9N8EPK2_9STRA|nr:cholinergic receptor, nicotinic [Seminavis robusta]|eukprot:Sro1704_g292390.1 cholinergic receptor, nicotinic (914) ;mRNA; r:16240-18981
MSVKGYLVVIIALMALHVSLDVYKYQQEIELIDRKGVSAAKSSPEPRDLLMAVGSSRSARTATVVAEDSSNTKGTVLDIIPMQYDDERNETTATGAPTNLADKLTFPPALGTNFQLRVPYNFSHVFFVGGHCNITGEEEWVQNDWYTRFAAAGMETLGVPPENQICSNVKNDAYTRDFHVEALRKVETLAGDELNQTLVITAAIRLESDWSPVADLLRRGMAFFHMKEDPQNFDLQEFGLDLERVLYFYFRWDEAGSAIKAGRELCRLKRGAHQLKAAKLLTGWRGEKIDFRVDLAIEAFKENCPNSAVIDLWAVYDNQSDQALRTTLIFNPFPDIIFTAQDAVARRIIDIAQDALPPDQYRRIATTGWDNIETQLLDEFKILTTVDQQVHDPHKGVWGVLETVLGIAQSTGLNSTASVQRELDLGNSLTITADTLFIPAHRVGYLQNLVLEGYNPNFSPFTSNPVSSGILNTTIAMMDPFEGKFEAIFVLHTSWYDPRLEWNRDVYGGFLALDKASIWTPSGIYFQNEIGFDSSQILHESLAMVSNDGKVRLETTMHAMFLCRTMEEIRRYPFEHYHCSMNLAGSMQLTLDDTIGFDVVQSDPHFETTISTMMSSNQQSASGIVYYKLAFQRRPFGVYVGVVLPGIVINMIGFMAFWIPGVEQSVALGIAALLCALTYRTALDIPDVASATWVEVFMMINISYLGSVMVIIWCSFGSSAILGKYINKCCKPIHPKNVAKEAKSLAKSMSRTHSDEKTRVVERVVETPNDTKQATIGSQSMQRQGELHRNGNKAQELSALSAHSADRIYDSDSHHKWNKASAALHHPEDPADSDLESDGPPRDDHNQQASGIEMNNGYRTKLKRFVSERVLGKGEGTDQNGKSANLDWIGRWFIVPSYIIVVSSLLIHGWGFK